MAHISASLHVQLIFSLHNACAFYFCRNFLFIFSRLFCRFHVFPAKFFIFLDLCLADFNREVTYKAMTTNSSVENMFFRLPCSSAQLFRSFSSFQLQKSQHIHPTHLKFNLFFVFEAANVCIFLLPIPLK
jgi:hypothetical protein